MIWHGIGAIWWLREMIEMIEVELSWHMFLLATAESENLEIPGAGEKNTVSSQIRVQSHVQDGETRVARHEWVVLLCWQWTPVTIAVQLQDVGESIQTKHSNIPVRRRHLPGVKAKMNWVKQRTLFVDLVEEGSIANDVSLETGDDVEILLSDVECSQWRRQVTDQIVDGSEVVFTISSEESVMTLQTHSPQSQLVIQMILVSLDPRKEKFKLKIFL